MVDSSTCAKESQDTRVIVKEGIKAAWPICLGYFPIGLAFGVLAQKAGLSALVIPELVTSGNPRHLDFFRPQLLVALPTFIFGLKTRSLGGTVVVGMLLFWLVGKFF